MYIDWNNFYYRVVKDTPYWWLDISKLMESNLKPPLKIEKIKIFTADLLPGQYNKFAIHKQKAYHEAISNQYANIEFIKGNYLPKSLQIPYSGSRTVKQYFEYKTFEEKGTDVNLALHMLNDSWLDLYDCAILVSNDTDFSEAMKMVRYQNKKTIGLFTPGKNRASG